MNAISIPGLTAAPPDLNRLEELVQCAERRVKRATEKLHGAQAEFEAAGAALERAIAARADWIASNPDPQLIML